MKIAAHTKSISATFFFLSFLEIVKADNLPPINPTGTYALRSNEQNLTSQSNGKFTQSTQVQTGFSGVIKVDWINQDKVLVDLNGNKGFPSFNQGSFTATLVYKKGMAVYAPVEYDKSCVITMKWLRNALVVSQSSDDANTACGFGHAVAVDGVYRKISSKRPKISTN
ncbi:MAG: hypothetical protein EOP71_03800 [Variovorax sp.]|jgi:hypothetical protein|nr:MAG: hypothetical protein EOP71_03800 [Variovorax sp.]